MDDILLDGFKVKKGDGAYAMGRMDYIWGDDAEEFRPERWLRNGIFQPESPFKFVAFHAGPRTCLGKDFAYRQMKIVSIALLAFFRFKLADETKNVTYKTMFTLHIDGGLHLHAISKKKSDVEQKAASHMDHPKFKSHMALKNNPKFKAKWLYLKRIDEIFSSHIFFRSNSII
ncbi:hypothetical protein Ddye_018207 [Dipteronia dyeriana]|uniref:Cytochrome P450 n=1 Tax=Dipteronia dyeriana TaxID=168575 RepID=A0AAD9X1K7_9ROSI|nr:hypothetical protein Ddye_018207 [Dipteronia dyeriana]